MMKPDFLDEIVSSRSSSNPKFLAQVEDAARNRSWARFMKELEAEAEAEGPEAVKELKVWRRHFREVAAQLKKRE